MITVSEHFKKPNEVDNRKMRETSLNITASNGKLDSLHLKIISSSLGNYLPLNSLSTSPRVLTPNNQTIHKQIHGHKTRRTVL